MADRLRAQSRKVRALEQAYGQPVEEIVLAFAREPLTYVEIAARWQARVAEAYPELGLTYGKDDVYNTFRTCGIRRRSAIYPKSPGLKAAAA